MSRSKHRDHRQRMLEERRPGCEKYRFKPTRAYLKNLARLFARAFGIKIHNVGQKPHARIAHFEPEWRPDYRRKVANLCRGIRNSIARRSIRLARAKYRTDDIERQRLRLRRRSHARAHVIHLSNIQNPNFWAGWTDLEIDGQD